MLHLHRGLDSSGRLHQRMRSVAEVRRARELLRLRPAVVSLRLSTLHVRWRNGLQRRRWLLVCRQVRGDRCCFLTTLKLPPLVSPLPPF